jgi:ankyrin repeat protein
MKHILLLLLTLPTFCNAKSAAATPQEPEIKRKETKERSASAAATRPVPLPLPPRPAAKGKTHTPKHSKFKPLPATPAFRKMMEEAERTKNFDRVLEHLKKQPQDIDVLSPEGGTILIMLIANLIKLSPEQQKHMVADLLPLIARAKSINYLSPQGITALIAAIGSQIPELVEILLKHGADVNLSNATDYIPLMEAMQGSQNHQIVKLLLTNGADVNATTDIGLQAIHTAMRRMLYPREYEFKTPDPKHQVETVKLLLKYGADIEAKVKSGMTTLMFAAAQGNIALTKLLLNEGADTESTVPSNGNTALIIAVGSRNAMHIQEYKGKDNKLVRYTPEEVRQNKQLLFQIIKLLLDHRANANATTARGSTPLSIAALAYDVPVVKELLLHGAIDFVEPGQPTILARLEEALKKMDHLSDPNYQKAAAIVHMLRDPQAFIKEHKTQMDEARESEYVFKDIMGLPSGVTQLIQEHIQGPVVKESESPEHVAIINRLKAALTESDELGKLLGLQNFGKLPDFTDITDQEGNNAIMLAIHYYEHDNDDLDALKAVFDPFMSKVSTLHESLERPNNQNINAWKLIDRLEAAALVKQKEKPKDQTLTASIERLRNIRKYLKEQLELAEQMKKGAK